MSARDFAELRAIDRDLLARVDSLMAWLGVSGKRTGNRWEGGNKGARIEVVLTGSNAGAWGAWSAGKKSRSLIGVIAHVRGISYGEAVREARAFLGDAAPPKKPTPTPPKTDDKRRAQGITYARKLWAGSRAVADTLGEVYLVSIRKFPRPADGWAADIRLHEQSRALILAGRDANGEVQFVNRIFLTNKGDNVRDIHGAKKKRTLGPMDGAAFRLPGDPLGPVLHAEGGETAIAAWLATGFETHCRFGTVGDAARPLPGRRNVILVDDDPLRHPTEEVLRRALRRWRAAGLDVLVAYPWPERRFDKSDFADILVADGAEAVRDRIQNARKPGFPDPPAWLLNIPFSEIVLEGNDGPQPEPKEPLANGSYLLPAKPGQPAQPGETNLPAYHPPITESRKDAEYRLKLSIKSFFGTATIVRRARREATERRAEALADLEELPLDATPEQKRERAHAKAAITRAVFREIAEHYGFGKRLPRVPAQLESGAQGNGKTALAINEVAKIEGAHIVHKYAPTLAKADEDLRDYRRVATEGSMPAMVVRGRSAADPLTEGKAMCWRPKVAERVAKLGLSPKLTICPSCSFQKSCGTMRQQKTIERLGKRAVFFMSREYAHLPCPAPKPDIIIADERMTLEAVTITSLEPEKMIDDLLPGHACHVGAVIEARKTLRRLRPILMAPQPLAALRDSHLDAKLLRKLKRELAWEPAVNFNGAMIDEDIDAELDKVDHPDRRHMLAIVSAILREIEAPRPTFNAIRYNARRNLIEAARLRRMRHGGKNTAVLFLDGTGDRELNEKLARRRVTHNVIRMERDAEVIGTIGKRYSRQSITGFVRKGREKLPIRPEAAKKLRDDIGQIAAQFEDPLLTATKDAVEALVGGGHLPANIMTSHNGMTRGRNEWEGRPTAIDAGPETISPGEAELIAGAVYATSPEPILPMPTPEEQPDGWPYKPWPCRATRLRRMRDGRLQIVHVDVHPDPRAQRVIEQIREAGGIQNLDRVRPIYNRRTLVPMNELVLDLTYDRVLRHRELVEGGTRIERILKRTDGVLPLTPAALSALFPDLAGSEATARLALRAWRREWGKNANRSPIWEFTPFAYRRDRPDGRPPVVMVSNHRAEPKAAAEAVLGPLSAFWEVGGPQPDQHPQPAPKPPQQPDGAPQAPPAWQQAPGGGSGTPIWQARAPPDD
jgi:hypothetical protein